MSFSTQDYEEPLMFFRLNEEDEEDDLLQPVCGKVFNNLTWKLRHTWEIFSTNLFLCGFSTGSHAA